MSFERDNTLWGRTRDSVAWSVANFALNRIATPWYRAMITGAIRLGLDAAMRGHDEEES